ncbi:hypothetical protein LMIY3S_02945 [Labrys miyagiensis]
MFEAPAAPYSEERQLPPEAKEWPSFDANAGRAGTWTGADADRRVAAGGHACAGTAAGRCTACPLATARHGRGDKLLDTRATKLEITSPA